MNAHIDDRLVLELRKLHKERDSARTLLDWAASRTNDAAETSVERLMQMARVGRPEAVELARVLEEIGCGEFIVGRKGWKSRMRWSYSLRSLGKAAQGQTAQLEDVDPELVEDAVDQPPPTTGMGTERPLTIAEAKRRLAVSFGIHPEAIDIVIRG